MKKFKLEFHDFNDNIEYFTEETAPDWLTCKRTVKGSTMDASFFWQEHVLKLDVGGVFNTDFRKITRVV